MSEFDARAAADRLPEPWRSRAVRLLGTETGSWITRVLSRLRSVEPFDRAMSIAAQFFTSLIPVSIAVGAVFGRDWQLGASLELPPDAAGVVEDAVAGSGTSAGLIGIGLVLILATSLSRTLTRLYCAVFLVPRPHPSVRLVGKWLAAVVCFFVAVALARVFRLVVEGLPFDAFWAVFGAWITQSLLWLVVPLLLLEGRLSFRQLLPGAVLAGLAWALVMVAGDVALAAFLTRSAAQYGVIGVAFTYLSWLYVLSFALVVAVVVGRELLPVAQRAWTPAAGTPADSDVGMD